MSRPFWKGSVTFGLVEIPVALEPATAREDEIEFRQLDRRDFSPVGYERVNKKTGRPVPWDEIVKGYEHEKGEFVAFTEEELRAASPEATHTIAIEDFVDGAEIDPVFWETPYFVVPTGKRAKSYALLRETLVKTGRVGVAKVVLRTRERLAALTVRGPAIVLVVLRYAHELRDAAEVSVPKQGASGARVDEKEKALARRLVESMTTKWNPKAYGDEYRKEVLALVARKVKAGKIHEIAPPEPAPGERRASGDVLDLMPLLRRSVERRTTRAVSASHRRAAPRTMRKRA